jgi:hypothetical protein
LTNARQSKIFDITPFVVKFVVKMAWAEKVSYIPETYESRKNPRESSASSTALALAAAAYQISS